jgi:hypothetical protein
MTFFLVYGLVIAATLDAFLMWRGVKAKVFAQFGEVPPKGSAMYAVMRTFQMRRTRLPRPQVERRTPRLVSAFKRK